MQKPLDYKLVPSNPISTLVACQMTRFSIGTMPFKYLGIPICSRRINAGECEQIIEKMTIRLRIWSSKNLSYAGWIKLIESVLLSLHIYWAQIMILPKSILKEIGKICKHYLWKGNCNTTSPGLITTSKESINQQGAAGGQQSISKAPRLSNYPSNAIKPPHQRTWQNHRSNDSTN